MEVCVFVCLWFVQPRQIGGLSLLVLLAGRVDGADSYNGPLASGVDAASTISSRFKLDETLGYESNPQFTNYRYNASTRHSSDGFSDSLGFAKFGFHAVPLNLIGLADEKDYFHTYALDTSTLHVEGETPFHFGKRTTIAPDLYMENQWDDGHYYQTETRFTARWTEEWSDILSTDISPYYSILSHSKAFEPYNGYDTGIDADVTWEIDRKYLEDYSIDAGTRRYHAETVYFGYQDTYVEGSADLTLGWGFDLRCRLKAAQDIYGAKEPGRKKVRDDRSLEPAITASRNMLSWFKVHVGIDFVTTRSNIRRDSYRDSVLTVGGTVKL